MILHSSSVFCEDVIYTLTLLICQPEKPKAAVADEPPAEKPSKDPFAALPEGYVKVCPVTGAMSSSHKGMLVYLCYNHVRTGGRIKLLSSGCLTFSVAHKRMVLQMAIRLYDFLDSKYGLVLQMATSSI